jgi:uncharacterized membrane protein
MKRALWLTLVLAAAPLAAQAASPPRYHVTVLGDAGRAYRLNDRGQVVGETDDKAFLYDGGMRLIDSLGGSASAAYGINAAGWVTGEIRGLDHFSHAFISDGATTHLADPVGAISSIGFSINDAGLITGMASYPIPTQPNWAIVYNADGVQTAGSFAAGAASGYAINNANEVVGANYFTNWQDAARNYFTAQDYGFTQLGAVLAPARRLQWEALPVSFRDGAAFDINNSGQYVGYIRGPGGPEAVRYDDGTYTLLAGAAPFSVAYGVNDAGQAVGNADFPGRCCTSFLYDGAATYDLNDLIESGWSMLEARDINNRGQIAGQAVDPFGFERPVRLDPISMGVPEPAAWAMLLAGFGLLGSALRRRKAAVQG